MAMEKDRPAVPESRPPCPLPTHRFRSVGEFTNSKHGGTRMISIKRLVSKDQNGDYPNKVAPVRLSHQEPLLATFGLDGLNDGRPRAPRCVSLRDEPSRDRAASASRLLGHCLHLDPVFLCNGLPCRSQQCNHYISDHIATYCVWETSHPPHAVPVDNFLSVVNSDEPSVDNFARGGDSA